MGGGFGEHPTGFETASGAGVDHDGFPDAGQLVRISADCEVHPACWARRRMRWAMARARTQDKTWTRIQRQSSGPGANDTTWGSFICRNRSRRRVGER